jgi:CheY-like chemotaxis protein
MRPKILLIEDDEPTIKFYQDVFQLVNFDFEAIQWGFKAIERLKEIREGKKEKPDLILLDLILLDINGLEILKEARKYPQTKDLLIFGLTNYTDPKLDEELIKEGIDKILVKTDYTPKELISLIKEALKLK